MSLTHLNQRGDAHMVDVGDKQPTRREARAQSFVKMSADTLAKLLDNAMPKGDVLATVRIAGIQAAKRTPELIPLCHPLPLTHVSIECTPDHAQSGVLIQALCRTDGKTGVEMEALTAASVAALTLFDMCKAVDKLMVIEETCVVEKSGGKSGDWQRQAPHEAVPQSSAEISEDALRLRFFGEVRDQVGVAEMVIAPGVLEQATPHGLLSHLKRERDVDLATLFQGRLLVAVNHQMSDIDTLISGGDEVAFFPPVTGG